VREKARVPAILPPYTAKNDAGEDTTSSRVPSQRSWPMALEPAKRSTDHSPESAVPTTT